ncbi:MAG TPA: HPF/RaiA family ribosome-associated protein [Myxococcales bacterium]|jgi:ribosomal subunit interface protein
MKLIVQGKQMTVSDNLQRYAEEHVLTPLTRFYDSEAAELRVEVGRANGHGGDSREVHLTLHMPGRKTIQIEETTPDTFAALDAAADRLVRTAKKEIARQRGRGDVKARRAAQALKTSGELPDLPTVAAPRKRKR